MRKQAFNINVFSMAKMKNDDGGFSCIPSILEIMPSNYYIADIRRLVHQCIDLKKNMYQPMYL